MIESGLLSAEIFLAKVAPKIGLEKYFFDFVLKTNPWTYIRHLNGEKILRSFYEKEFLLSKV